MHAALCYKRLLMTTRNGKPGATGTPKRRTGGSPRLADDELLAALQAAGQPLALADLATRVGVKAAGHRRGPVTGAHFEGWGGGALILSAQLLPRVHSLSSWHRDCLDNPVRRRAKGQPPSRGENECVRAL